MAGKNTTAAVQNKKDDLVPFYAFKDSGKYRDDITVGLNGRVYKIKRGEQVMIPRAVSEILENSAKQDRATADLIDNLSDRYKAARNALD